MFVNWYTIYMKSFLKILAVLIFVLTGFQSAQGATTEHNCAHNSNHKCVNLKGYAWGADSSPFGGIGWINFNNGNATTEGGSGTANGVTYKVEFDRNDQTLHGYAWSENFGYIKFGDFAEVANGKSYPSASACKNASNTDANCNAQLVSSGAGYQMVGYARFCFVYQSGCSGTVRPNSELGGNDGWIAFKGTANNWGVTYSTGSNNSFGGYAWAGGAGDKANTQYGKGAGWLKMSPTNGGVSCFVDSSAATADCLDDNDKPTVTLIANPNPAKYTEDVTISWEINSANGCSSVSTSSTPTNSTWNSYTPNAPTGGSNTKTTGTKFIGKITEPTTFTLSCTYNGKKGTADVLVDLLTYTPKVTLSAPATVTYGQTASIDYTVTNIPYGCSSAILYSNGYQVDTTSISGNGTDTYVASGSFTRTITSANNWEFQCTDNTAPSPERVGSATAKTSPIVPAITLSLSVTDKTTNKTTAAPSLKTGLIPCTNTGVDITYSAADAANIKSCNAYIDMNGSNADWGSSTSINTDGSPHTVTINNVTATGDMMYQLQCKKLDNSLVTYAVKMNRTCTPGSLSVSAAATCVTPSDNIDITYTGAGLVANTCTKSWGGKVNQSNFNLHYITPASSLTVGQTYTYTVDSCQDASDPNGTALSDSVSVQVQNTCSTPTTCTGSSNRCNPGKGPVFKEF
jgi:hypothetical protein